MALKEKSVKILLIWITTHLFSCGENPFQNYQDPDPAEVGAVHLEKGEPDKAIEVLTQALKSDATNTKYLSVLSTAYAAKAGIDILAFAVKVIQSQQSTSNGITGLFGLLPEATDEHIDYLSLAIKTLQKIPVDSRILADTFKLGLFHLIQLALIAKSFDTGSKGYLDINDLQNMTPAKIALILDSLETAAVTFGAGNAANDTNSVETAKKIVSIQTDIQNSTGSTSEEKLKNYLSSSGVSQSQIDQGTTAVP